MQNIFFISFEKGWTFLLFQVMDTYIQTLRLKLLYKDLG